MNIDEAKNIEVMLEKALSENNGILRLKPSWVARDFLLTGKNLGLKDEEYETETGAKISERWVGSTTRAETGLTSPNEGLSLACLSEDIDNKATNVFLADVIKNFKEMIMGKEYSKTHNDLDRLAKVFCYSDRLFYHVHQRQQDVEKLGRKSKEEAYYFPENFDLGLHPETFFGVHPYIAQEKKYDILLPYIIEWKDDRILKHARGYVTQHDDGFHLPAGIPHAPSTALTIELQENSDVLSVFQALVGGKILSKQEMLYHDVAKEDKEKYGERIALQLIDWEASGDPYFYENHHTPPIIIEESKQQGGSESWIFYNTNKFSGKKTVVKPGEKYISTDKGVYNILVWEGKGKFDGHFIEAYNFGYDELLVTHDKAIKPLTIENDGEKDLVIFKFFGPGINKDVPMLKKYIV